MEDGRKFRVSLGPQPWTLDLGVWGSGLLDLIEGLIVRSYEKAFARNRATSAASLILGFRF